MPTLSPSSHRRPDIVPNICLRRMLKIRLHTRRLFSRVSKRFDSIGFGNVFFAFANGRLTRGHISVCVIIIFLAVKHSKPSHRPRHKRKSQLRNNRQPNQTSLAEQHNYDELSEYMVNGMPTSCTHTHVCYNIILYTKIQVQGDGVECFHSHY